jgi:hypothetical protein
VKQFIKYSMMIMLVFSIVILATQVLAAGGATEDKKHNFAGGSTAIAYKDVIVIDSSWNGQIRSYMSPSYNIGTIGWTWWTIRELCAGIILDQYQYNGQAYYGASYIADSAVDDVDYCGWGWQGTVLGTHDFKDGSSSWQPYSFHSEPLP